ncbi:MAG TPA: FUSC family protein [Herbaspirillum sp.]|nr:FUSC family protein [Herbaspirillum sp.]
MPKRLLFAVRCAASGTVAYLLATAIGLPHPVWASMSSLIVSQESIEETRHSIVGRVIGTITGAVVAIMVSTVAHHIGIGTALQIAVAVGLCALFASGHPAIRVCLWTCPIVLLTAVPGSSVEHAGLMRGSEVILGALAGGLIHWLMLLVTTRQHVSCRDACHQ